MYDYIQVTGMCISVAISANCTSFKTQSCVSFTYVTNVAIARCCKVFVCII